MEEVKSLSGEKKVHPGERHTIGQFNEGNSKIVDVMGQASLTYETSVHPFKSHADNGRLKHPHVERQWRYKKKKRERERKVKPTRIFFPSGLRRQPEENGETGDEVKRNSALKRGFRRTHTHNLPVGY